jgi:hypothetical protein
MDVCAGGTINAGATSITFTNHHKVPCNITSCALPGFPKIPPPVTVPAKVGSTPGTITVPLNPPPTQTGDYEYTPDCCDLETNPVIKVQ